ARARRELLAAGLDHRTVERHVAGAHTTRAMVALAVMGVDRVMALDGGGRIAADAARPANR
ncbi:hypothetical protein, partial [Nocardia farcinica]|uniref:hypothetical protein n=1 Tax=Nocardia farcinica TaxID=37329 RepID=UPI002458D5F2